MARILGKDGNKSQRKSKTVLWDTKIIKKKDINERYLYKIKERSYIPK